MFVKETLYINAIKYAEQLKVDCKKIDENGIIEAHSSNFLAKEDILNDDIAFKINSLKKEAIETYITSLLINDTTKLILKKSTKKIKNCKLANFDDKYDIAVLKSTLFETKNFFIKTGIDFIYSIFHIMNHLIIKHSIKSQFLLFLFNNKVFILVVDKNSEIVYNKIEDMPTYDSVKKSHFYDDDFDAQKLFNEIYYFELVGLINKNLNEYYMNDKKELLDKINIMYSFKQLKKDHIEKIKEEFPILLESHTVNIEEELFELTRGSFSKKSFIIPEKKLPKKKFFKKIIFPVFFVLFVVFGYKAYEYYIDKQEFEKKLAIKTNNKITANIPDHVNVNDRIKKRLESILEDIPDEVVLNKVILNKNSMTMNINVLKEDTYNRILKPKLDLYYYSNVERKLSKNKKIDINLLIKSKNKKELVDVIYEKNKQKYISEKFISISMVSEQLKILFPEDTLITFKSQEVGYLTKYYYKISMPVKEPKEFYELIKEINKELYSICIQSPFVMQKVKNGLKLEFILMFSQFSK